MPKVHAAATSGADSHQGWCPSSTAFCSASASSIPPSGQTKCTSADWPVWSAVGGGGSVSPATAGGKNRRSRESKHRRSQRDHEELSHWLPAFPNVPFARTD